MYLKRWKQMCIYITLPQHTLGKIHPTQIRAFWRGTRPSTSCLQDVAVITSESIFNPSPERVSKGENGKGRRVTLKIRRGSTPHLEQGWRPALLYVGTAVALCIVSCYWLKVTSSFTRNLFICHVWRHEKPIINSSSWGTFGTHVWLRGLLVIYYMCETLFCAPMRKLYIVLSLPHFKL